MVKSVVLPHTRLWFRAPPMLVDMSAGLWVKRLSCHVDHYSRCHSKGESVESIVHKQESMQETQSRNLQKSKTGVSVTTRKGLASSKNFIQQRKTLETMV